MLKLFRTFVEGYIMSFGGGKFAADLTMLVITAVLAVLVYAISKKLFRLLEHLVLRSPSEWDNDLLNDRMLRAIAQLAPALAVSWTLPAFFDGDKGIPAWVGMLTSFYMLWAVIRIFLIFVSNLYTAMTKRDNTKEYAIKGVFQMFKLIILGIAVIIGISIFFGKEPTAILAALGASAAVLSFVFKDTILGFVAGVQLSANNMVQKGDWIESSNHDIDGMVTDVSLTTVKIRNWDNSVSTIPPYTLISDSFRNYQAMVESGGRRVCRSINIDVNTVRMCTKEELDILGGEGYLEGIDIDPTRGIVNLQLLRYYLKRFLATDPRVNTTMTCMVRQLAPTTTGIPLQLYFFTKNTAWVEYETIQADIFDYVYATVNKFGLSIFQSPAGSDIIRL